MLNITNHKGNANQNTVRYHFIPVRYGCYQKDHQQQVLMRMCRIENRHMQFMGLWIDNSHCGKQYGRHSKRKDLLCCCLVPECVQLFFGPMISSSSPPGSSVHGIFPGKNTGMSFHFLLQGIFPTQGLNLGFLLCRWFVDHWASWEAPGTTIWSSSIQIKQEY